MKSIYLISSARICGPVNQAINIVSGLRRFCNIDTRLVTLSPEIEGNSWMNRIDDAKLPHDCLNTSKTRIYQAVIKLRKYLHDNSIEVIHSSGFRANLVASMMPKKYLKISTQRCAPNDIGEKFSTYLRPFLTKCYLIIIDKLDCNVACSHTLQKTFKDLYNRNIKCVPNCVDTDYFTPLAYHEKKKLQRELGIDINKRIFLILGSLSERKNNITAITVFNQLRDIDAQLVIVGNGPEMEFLKTHATNPNIIFTGETSEPIKYLRASDILISCSLAEGLPNTVLEAISCGLPCILSNIGPHKEIIDNNSAGELFTIKDTSALKEIVIEAMNWDNTKGYTARQLALNEFGISTLAKRYYEIYEQ